MKIIKWYQSLLVKKEQHFATMKLHDFQVKELLDNLPKEVLAKINENPTDYDWVKKVVGNFGHSDFEDYYQNSQPPDLARYYREGTHPQHQVHFTAIAIFEYLNKN